jgi:hypothetical protein
LVDLGTAMTSTDDTPSLPKWPLSLAVLGSSSVAVSTTISLPSAALADSAAAQRQLADLLRQVRGVAAHDRAERLAAAAELRRRLVAVAGAAGALLGVHLLGRRRDFGAALGLVRALLAARQLPHHAALQDVLADGAPNTASARSISPALSPSMVLTAIFMV